ncbi:MAG: lipoprotein-releasing system ATP-binding protein LolD, partial [Candidatus Marinimicrobia bacterium]|nr:lipoprotein-releasing system ATP-binding protein LolD [Candidatus Neomarinimicrobiota bacterium]
MILQAINLTKSFQNGEKVLSVLDKVSIEINKRDFITIMGESGAGKSTLLNILGTLDVATSGSLMINKENINDQTQDQIAELRNKYFGFVFQFHHLLPDFTAFENVLIPNQIAGNDGDDKKAVELLGYIGLENRMDHFPSQLSGGERLRVAVVRALMNNPKLLLADEPTGNLDIGNSIKLMKLFQR